MTPTTPSDRPLVTFFVCTYQQEKYVAEAVEGAFRQTYSPLEIFLSDDCSSDRTFSIMRDMAESYLGPHVIRLNRNERNLGVAGHLNRAMELVRGELVVVAAGDDISLPHRTERVVEAWLASGRRAHSIDSAVVIMDETGRDYGVHEFPHPPPEMDLIDLCRTLQVGVAGVSHAWHRAVFDRFGPLNEDVINEDWTIPFRSRCLGTIVHLPEPLVRYRRHEGSISDPRQTLPAGEHLRMLKRRGAEFSLATFRQWQADFAKLPNPLQGHSEVIAFLTKRALYDRATHDQSFQVRWKAFCHAVTQPALSLYCLKTFPKRAFWHFFNIGLWLTQRKHNWQIARRQRAAPAGNQGE